jgi:hypothetical protein
LSAGRAKSASTEVACAETGVRARFLTGRWERRSAEVGIESGPGSDILESVLVEFLTRRDVGKRWSYPSPEKVIGEPLPTTNFVMLATRQANSQGCEQGNILFI